MTVPARRSAVRDQRARHVDEREVVLGDRLPANAQRAVVVVPAVRSFDDPATSATAFAAVRDLAATSEVRLDSTQPHRDLGVAIVVSLVEAELLRPTRTARCSKGHGIERLAGHPLVVDVRAGQRDGDRDAASVGEDVTFRSKFSAISRIGPGELPPFGAFTEALSSEAQAQSMPRCSS